ncbi:hypothetical protein GYMLUDRAFT_85822, partial [Collybiopsis luxurians FD-317 M1]
MRCLYFPCVTVQGLERTFREVEKLLDDHDADTFWINMKHSEMMDIFMDYEERLLLVHKSIIDWFIEDLRAEKPYWMRCLASPKNALGRIKEISSSYKNLQALRSDIEHSRAMISKG